MLSDYIPVYWPESNTWSIPTIELKEYEDYVAKPQNLVLFHEGNVVRGIPLLHFGTWGIVGVDVTATIRHIAKSPKEACAKAFRSGKVAAETAAFFEALKNRYPKIVSVREFRKPRSRKAKYLGVPARCVVKFAPRKRPRL